MRASRLFCFLFLFFGSIFFFAFLSFSQDDCFRNESFVTMVEKTDFIAVLMQLWDLPPDDDNDNDDVDDNDNDDDNDKIHVVVVQVAINAIPPKTDKPIKYSTS